MLNTSTTSSSLVLLAATSTFTAEFSRWFLALIIAATFLVDGCQAATIVEVKIATIVAVCLSTSFGKAVEKFGDDPQLVFLGILLDTRTRTARIYSVSSKWFLEQP